jgi:hypothetical protein
MGGAPLFLRSRHDAPCRSGRDLPVSLLRIAEHFTGTRALEHFPEKWTPVFRRKCDQIKMLERFSIPANGKAL